jgi:hypothetical protein
MKELMEEFCKVLKSKLSAWYLHAKNDYSGCETCGTYDDTKPDCETVYRIIDETLEEIFKEIK